MDLGKSKLEANGRVPGGASHKFNAICHGRETAEITEVEKLQESPKSGNCTNRMQCFNLRCAKVKKNDLKLTLGSLGPYRKWRKKPEETGKWTQGPSHLRE